MENRLHEVRIQNFKSLKDVTLSCERINLIVGKPNVGKSNILEALALLGAGYLLEGKFGNSYMRYSNVADLFNDGNYQDTAILVAANKNRVESSLIFNGKAFKFNFTFPNHGKGYADVSPDGSVGNRSFQPGQPIFPLKYFTFYDQQSFKQSSASLALEPPHGANLLDVLTYNKEIRQEASHLFEQYGLELLVDRQSGRIDIIKKLDGILFKQPYELSADTLRRYLFHIAAVASNRDSVLLFEEPESHNYPPYIQQLAHRIMEENTNQYFITTHNPFLFNTFVEEAKDLAVFLVDIENYETRVHRLSESQLSEMLNYGLNIFTQQEIFM